MVNAQDIQEHMDVMGSDGGHIGTVDHLDGNRIKLTKSDPAAGGEHHYLDLDMVAAWADKLGAPIPMLEQARSLYTRLVESGMSELDTSAVFKLYESRSIP